MYLSVVRGLLLGLVLLARPAQAAWDRFEIIEWQARDPARLATLRQLGITAVTVIADRDGTGTPLDQQTAAPRTVGLRWYIENIATDFYAPYHRYTPGKPVTWRFLAAQERYHANPGDPTALFREPSLLDQGWRNHIRDRLIDTVTRQKPFHPLYYSLGDETGIDDLGSFWDFDLSPPSVAGYRKWLRDQYGSLTALNAEWGTAYTDWDAIQPETTRDALIRGGPSVAAPNAASPNFAAPNFAPPNFAPWNDFKAWMDTSFADALRFGTDAVHRADPHALSAIEGVQIPGWGGYDYTKLARSVDLMEIYDGDENLPLMRAFNPDLIPLITSFTGDSAGLHAIWRSVLRGARGLILWDEDDSIVRPDASPGPRAAAYAPVFAALNGEIGRRMIAAQPIYDAVAILYSPASFRMTWILDQRGDPDAWSHRTVDQDLADNAWRVALRDYASALARMGLHPRFITPDDLAHGPPDDAALILPHGVALSDAEARAIAAFAAKGGVVIADTPPGQFDAHGRPRPDRSIPASIVAPAELPGALKLDPAFRVEVTDGNVETWLFRSEGTLMLALQRRTPGDASGLVSVDLKGWRARDIGSGEVYNGKITLTLDPITPIFLELRAIRTDQK